MKSKGVCKRESAKNCILQFTDFEFIVQGELGNQEGGFGKQCLSADCLSFDRSLCGTIAALAPRPSIHDAKGYLTQARLVPQNWATQSLPPQASSARSAQVARGPGLPATIVRVA